MVARQLIIQIDPAGLTALAAADQRVTLVRSAAGSRYPVAWLVIAPLGRITVGWDARYRVYQSTTAVQAGERLRVGSTADAVPGYLYPFAGGRFGPGSATLGAAEVGIRNADRQVTMRGVAMFVAGLSQTAAVNDQPAGGPVDLQPVLLNQTVITSVCERVLVLPTGGLTAGTVLSWRWLREPDGSAGCAGPAGPAHPAVALGQPLAVDLARAPDQTIHYDPGANRFVPGPG